MPFAQSINHSQALKMIQQALAEKRLDVEHIPVVNAMGRVAAADVLAPIDVPTMACSRMDGYAINTALFRRGDRVVANSEQSGTWRLSLGAAVHAQRQTAPVLCGEQAIPIMTGGVLPEDADAIILKEQVELTEEGIRFDQLPSRGSHIRPRGSDLKAGQRVLKANTPIQAGMVGVLSSLGLAEVAVYAAPKVALMVTGDELVQPGADCGPGEIYDANAPMLQNLLQTMGCQVAVLSPLGDTEEAVRQRLSEMADAACDLIISVGGVSMGDKDLIPEMLAELGTVLFHKVRVKPGFPLLFGRLGGGLFFGLPGNPVSCYTTLCQYIWPAIRLLNQQNMAVAQWRAVLTHEVKKSHLRREFMRAHFDMGHDGLLQVSVCGDQQSSRIESLAQANCFLVLNESDQDLSEGSSVLIQPFAAWRMV
ncbi:molybdopterin molybdotransferase MoeA [Marinicella meishanensis]|uniref:molybdopterin molybdotransferase MoeA n=1 Tax=Marinicella meishanensis TaxID=2873263 RepID=UPI001CBEE67A|nr:gephyrin-like molybdotransferase Glp [Marinicella sp. NBU2979]